MDSQEGTQQPHLILAHKLFLLNQTDVPDIEKVSLREDVLSFVKSDDMAPLYETLAASGVLEMDQSVLDSMQAKNKEEITKLDENVFNNGDGIPVEVHKEEGVYVPEMIFGHLLTSSNYDDDVKKTTGGRNGFGAKLTNIFSTVFTIETADGRRQKKYKQILVIFYSLGIGAIPWLIMSEILPVNIKSLAGSVATMLNWFLSWVVTMTANLLLDWSSGEERVSIIGGHLTSTPEAPKAIKSETPTRTRPPITTHVLDISRGCPASSIEVRLEKWSGNHPRPLFEEADIGGWVLQGSSITDNDGRSGQLMGIVDSVKPGIYKISFNTGKYCAGGFFPYVSIVFEIKESQKLEHFHVPLLFSPFSFSTYRGS